MKKMEGCIEVPDMPVNLTGPVKNRVLLNQYGMMLRSGQSWLDRVPTSHVEEALGEVSKEELALFKQIEVLNREAVTAVLKMRKLITNVIIRVGL